MTTALVARLDSAGDVLLAGPAVRAVRAGVDRLVLLCGPRGEAAARLLPDVDEVLVWHCPWIDAQPRPVDPTSVEQLVTGVGQRGVDLALVLTSFHQNALPTALLLRLADVGWIGAVSPDFPGSLLDLRHLLPDAGLHEVERSLSLCAAAGFPSPADDGLAVRLPTRDTARARYVVVHPGAAAPSRAPEPAWSRALVAALVSEGRRVLVTGGPGDEALTAFVADGVAEDLGGQLELDELAAVLSAAQCVVVGNTGPAHLAAAVRTPVVSLFSPVVPAERWRPWRVPHVLLGDQRAVCAGSRARACPVDGHPCLDIPVRVAVEAVEEMAAARTQVRA